MTKATAKATATVMSTASSSSCPDPCRPKRAHVVQRRLRLRPPGEGVEVTVLPAVVLATTFSCSAASSVQKLVRGGLRGLPVGQVGVRTESTRGIFRA